MSELPMPDNDDSLQALAGEYVLGTLPAAARREVEARLADDAALRRAVDQWEQRLLPLTALVEPAEPTGALWERITHSVADLERPAPLAGAAPRSARATGWWHSLALWRGLAAAGCAAAVVMASLLVAGLPGRGTPQYLVVLVGPQDKSPGWVVQAGGRNAVDLIPLGTTPVPAGRSLQFWTKADSWRGPVSLGLVQPGQVVHVPLASLPPLQANQLFELTLEPAQGSPTDRPTGPVQFIGRAVKVL
ncbi:anti-sigma factor domain-containing protein [Xylophilus sp. GOD-11R]|uniref:anti-sigma factor n=1 Tax=Xylophilus sp. GOD-11R TaxID=3089814 RepID=UPI00298C2E2D|nr:anti-sigma factor [Xylophilus sp. GOD-11R]WPB57264.1 anti-sigma factor [Xylophilus sp. GOD-11R]